MPKVKEIQASVGSSAEIRGVWYKFQFSITLEIEEGDDLAEVKRKAWNTCNDEVIKQLDEIAK
jgi:hypothetical protein